MDTASAARCSTAFFQLQHDIGTKLPKERARRTRASDCPCRVRSRQSRHPVEVGPCFAVPALSLTTAWKGAEIEHRLSKYVDTAPRIFPASDELDVAVRRIAEQSLPAATSQPLPRGVR